MPRLFKITTFLMGLFLIIQTLSGWLLRRTDPDERVPLLAKDILHYENQRLLQVWPGIPRPLYLTPTLIRQRLYGVDARGEVAYFGANNDDLTRLMLYRIQPTNDTVQVVVPDAVNEALWVSPNFRWVMYPTATPDGSLDYRVYNLNTHEQWSISEAVNPRTLIPYGHHQFSADEQWLYLSVQDPHLLSYEIMAVRLTDRSAIELTAGPTQTDEKGKLVRVGDWLIFSYNDHYYRLSTDGSTVGPLLDLTQVFPLNTGYPITTDDLSWVHSGHGIVIIYHADVMAAVEVATGRLLWQQAARVFEPFQPRSPDWAILNTRFCCQRLHIPTGAIQQTRPDATLPKAQFLLSSPDDRWIMYAQPNPATGILEWWQYEWATTEARLIRTNMDNFAARGLSPDGKWILVENLNSHDWYRLRLDDGHMELLLTGGIYRPVAWMRPLTRTWQPFPLLFIASALLIIGLIPRRLLKRGRRTW
ncbi:MAG: hypothetical protein K8L91_17270 [Anaerolineae bacterium]|nr:hypothetical protein [Anaerolineae bacterium]